MTLPDWIYPSKVTRGVEVIDKCHDTRWGHS